MDPKLMLDLIKSRRSVRCYSQEPVPQELVRNSIEAAIWAPRAGNRRHWRIISVQSPEKRGEMAAAVEEEVGRQRSYVKSERALNQFDAYTGHFTHFLSAPVLLVMVAKRYDSIYTRILSRVPEVSMGEGFEPGMASALMAAENLLLAASGQGLGSCFLSGPLVAHGKISSLLALDEAERLAGFITLGYPLASEVEETGTHSRSEKPEEVLSYV